MASQGPNPSATSNLLSTHGALIDTLCSFLTVSIHHLLYLRRLYPPVSFVSVRAYNSPVRQSRHPAVCRWVQDAIAAVRDQLEKNAVDNVALCIYECDHNNTVLERWIFDLRQFPIVDKRNRDVPFAQEAASPATAAPPPQANSNSKPQLQVAQDSSLRKPVSWADLEAHFRAILSRIGVCAGKLSALPGTSTLSSSTKPTPQASSKNNVDATPEPECSFTLSMQVRESADRPVGTGPLSREERKWIAAEPDPFSSSSSSSEDKDENGEGFDMEDAPGGLEDEENSGWNGNTGRIGARRRREANKGTRSKGKGLAVGKTHPVRRLEAGELRMEVWCEESAAKQKYLVKRAEAAAAAAARSDDTETGPMSATRKRPSTSTSPNRRRGGGAGVAGDRTIASTSSAGGGSAAAAAQLGSITEMLQWRVELEPPAVNRKPDGGRGVY